MPAHRYPTASGLLLALALVVGGCGSGDSTKDGPGKAASACRDQWKNLSDDVGGRDVRTNPSALAPRWNSIAATIDYHATSARASDCGKALTDVTKAMTALTAFGGRLAAYDMELRLERVQPAAAKYAAGPRPTSPTPKALKGKKGAKGRVSKRPLPPSPAEVAKALKTLDQQAPIATRQQEAGWQQASVIDLADAKAVKKAVKDLAFLSSESSGYRASTAALATISKAQKQAAKN